MTASKPSLSLLIALLLLKGVALGVLIALHKLDLAPDEAQYWTWSQNLAWGYYSKPPAIAWQIGLTTALLGNTPLGVRAGALLLGFCLPLAVYMLSRVGGLSKRASFWAALALAFSPLGFYLSFAATTDPGSILFLTLATAVIAHGLHTKIPPNYPLAGFFIMLGALYKWTAFAFWLYVLLALFFAPSLRKKSLLLGLLISLLALLPTLYWNATHDFATFRHVGGTLYKAGEQKGNIFDFLGAQFGLLSPVFFILLALGLAILYTHFKKNPPSLLFAGLFPLTILLLLGLSLFKKMQPNWGAFLYPPGMAVLGWYATKKHPFWLHFGIWLSIFGITIGLAIPWLQESGLAPIPYKANPFRQNLGWRHLSAALNEAGYDPEKDFLFADKYQATSLLYFYGPTQKPAYFLNLNKQRKNQFSYWEQMNTKERGKTGYFLLTENVTEKALPWYEHHYLEKLAPYCTHVTYAGAYPLFTAKGTPVKHALLFKCINYNGTLPPDPEEY